MAPTMIPKMMKQHLWFRKTETNIFGQQHVFNVISKQTANNNIFGYSKKQQIEYFLQGVNAYFHPFLL